MNCFEWNNRVSDYLDGTLIGTPRREADEHLESCSDCKERHKHYRVIITSIANQPRSALPIPIRKAPYTQQIPRLHVGWFSRSRWEQLPWYLRTTLEGTGIVLLILLGISAGPKVRSIYEKRLEHSMTEFNDAFNRNIEGDPTTNLPLTRGKSVGPSNPNGLNSEIASGQSPDEFASEGSENEDDSTDESDGGSDLVDEKDVRVGTSEIWRFNVKTDSPHEVRPKIVQILTDLHLPAGTPGLGGIEAPGGIQFDLMVPQSIVPGLMKHLQKLAPPTPEGLSGTPMGETFTWYKNRSKRQIPSGRTHVVIWLNQI